jgi:hypothetical protein
VGQKRQAEPVVELVDSEEEEYDSEAAAYRVGGASPAKRGQGQGQGRGGSKISGAGGGGRSVGARSGGGAMVDEIVDDDHEDEFMLTGRMGGSAALGAGGSTQQQLGGAAAKGTLGKKRQLPLSFTVSQSASTFPVGGASQYTSHTAASKKAPAGSAANNKALASGWDD